MNHRHVVQSLLCASLLCAVVWVPAASAEQPSCAECGECVDRLLAEIESRGWLGMALHIHGENRIDGLEVQFLDSDGPAAQVGVRSGDRIVRMQGLEIAALSPEEIETLLRGLEPGDKVAIELIRDGIRKEFELRARRMTLKARAEALGSHFLRERALAQGRREH